MSMFQEWCRRADEPDRRSSMCSMGTYSNSSSNRVKQRRALWKVVVGMLIGLRFIMQFVLRAFWVKDKRTAVSGGAGVELWPRKLATAKFWLDDMQVVKKAVADAVSSTNKSCYLVEHYFKDRNFFFLSKIGILHSYNNGIINLAIPY